MLSPTKLAFLANDTKSACWLSIKLEIYVTSVKTTSTSFTLATLLLGSILVDH